MQAGNLPIVGFCFSFPMEQDALDHGKLMLWTKVRTVHQDPQCSPSSHLA
jgi:hexokinase